MTLRRNLRPGVRVRHVGLVDLAGVVVEKPYGVRTRDIPILWDGDVYVSLVERRSRRFLKLEK